MSGCPGISACNTVPASSRHVLDKPPKSADMLLFIKHIPNFTVDYPRAADILTVAVVIAKMILLATVLTL